MKKLKKHFKQNMPIYAVVLVCIVIIGISLFITRDVAPEEVVVDTSKFKQVNLQETLELFESDEPKLLVISLNTCSATVDYATSLTIAEAKFGYDTYYLELSEIDESQIEDYNKLVEKLDYEYNFRGQVDKFGSFIGTTPMTIIIKNKKQVFGYIGSLDVATLENITNLYGIATIKS